MTNFAGNRPVAAGKKERYRESMAAKHQPATRALATAVLLWLGASLQARADQIVMQSGDHLVGRLVALTNDTLVVQSELLGTVRLPRSKVVSITLSAGATTNSTRPPAQTSLPHLAAAPVTNTSPDVSAALRQSGGNSNLMQQVREQCLSTAGPDANKKFDELFGGLKSGKLDVNDIRAEAASAANQIRALKRELGEDAGGSLDGYLAILESFLGETGAPAGSNANAANTPRKPKPAPAKEAE